MIKREKRLTLLCECCKDKPIPHLYKKYDKKNKLSISNTIKNKKKTSN